MPSLSDLGNRISSLENGHTWTEACTFEAAATCESTLTVEGAVTTDVALAATCGTGISGGTGTICDTYRRTENGVIITTYKIDVTGLTAKGGNADDAIGTGTTPAYIDRVVTSTHGIIFKIEMSCLELGTAASGTITNWIDLTAESAGTVDFDETAGTDQVLDAVDAWVAGETIVNLVPTVTANDWLYLTEGNTAASTGVYASGQYIITLYGHAILT